MEIKLTKTLFCKRKVVLNFIMRTFIFLFCAAVFGFTPKNSFSQNVKIVVDKNKTVTVDEVFNLIKKQTEYTFFYRADLFKDHPKVELRKGVISATELLQKSIRIKDFNFDFADDNTITISKKEKTDEPAQDTFTITGTVTDELGGPLAGATVYVTSNNIEESNPDNISPDFLIRGTHTDFDGNFTLEVSLNYYLVVSFIGFEFTSQQITTKQESYKIVLKESVNTLDEVVISGITRTQKARSSAAASKITKENISRQVTTNLDDKLEGLSPGLTLNTVTSDGGQARLELVLRGISTFNEPGQEFDPILGEINRINRQPLIILDGFPYEGPFNDIDAETIETIDILRDAAATAIWGVRAANGVLVITTKRGRIGKPRISFKSNLTFGTKQDLDKFGLASASETIKILNAFQELEPTSFSNRANSAVNGFTLSSQYTQLSVFEEIWAQFYAGSIDETQRDAQLAMLGQRNVLPQFEDAFIRGGTVYQNSLNINGGGFGTRYNFTATHTKEERPAVGDNFERLNLALTTDMIVNEKLKAVLDVSLANTVTRDNGIGVSDLYSNGTGPGINMFDNLVDSNGNALPILDVFSDNLDGFLTNGFEDISYSPITDRRLRNNETRGFNLRLAAGINYKFFDWLSADLKYQYNRISETVNNVRVADLYRVRRANNSYITGLDTGNGVTRGVPYGGTLERREQLIANDVFRGTLNFNKTYGGEHFVTALAGMEVSQNSLTVDQQQFFGYDDTTGLYDVNFHPGGFGQFGSVPGAILFGSVSNSNLYTPEIISRVISSFANVGYTYKDRYNFEASGKIDQSSTFGLGKRLSKPLLWATGASWNIHNEDFFNSAWVNQLKLRLSYGKNGNLRRGLTAITTIRYSVDRLNNEPDALIDNPGNPDITFEQTTTKNLGLDFRIFNNLAGSIDVYDKSSTDLLTLKNINSTLGQTDRFGEAVFTNNGEISNKGFELALASDIIQTDNFNWNANFNISHNRNKVVSYGFIPETDASGYMFDVDGDRTQIVGHPVSSAARYRWAGLDSEGNPQVFNDNNEPIGYLATPDELPTIAGLEVTKPFIAPTFGGLTNRLTYKNLTLSFLMTFKFGHVFQESLRNKYPYTGANFSHAFHRDIANAWENPGDEAFTDIPAIPRTASTFFSEGETGFDRRDLFERANIGILDASHIRLRDITLNYNMGSEGVKKLGFEAINFTFQARNLGLLWTANDKDIDPESVPFSGRAITFAGSFPSAYRPGIRVPVSFVFSAQFNF
ncbi:SusC/RagA family TonB-linked outer membrane protein [Seonamhaeicola sp.]|uniref:SusC/RagA family TonB-linked outer membrane protein n=1 Tax=Seonamhaeicola sp. TaxID=1912245 RepID=UPI00260E2D13|nr:SusC/RagA family TonB-linked outer membrane protein [Seonamhaeicola sp.]